MKAVMIDKETPADDICLKDVPVPKVKPGWVLVKGHAFGMNHSEQVLRMYVIHGIECVGEIEDSSDSGWEKGHKVCALMGGMGCCPVPMFFQYRVHYHGQKWQQFRKHTLLPGDLCLNAFICVREKRY